MSKVPDHAVDILVAFYEPMSFTVGDVPDDLHSDKRGLCRKRRGLTSKAKNCNHSAKSQILPVFAYSFSVSSRYTSTHSVTPGSYWTSWLMAKALLTDLRRFA